MRDLKYLNTKSLLATFFVLVVLGLPKTFAQEIKKITLQEAVELTLSNNLQIKQAQFQTQISDETLIQSKFALYPSLNGSSSANRQFGLFFDNQTGSLNNTSVDQVNGRLSSSITLFGGGTLINQIKQNKSSLLSDKSNLEKIRNDLSLTVVTTFIQIINNQDFVKASLGQLSLSKQQLEITKKKFDVGNNTQADLSQTEAQVANNELSVTNAQNALDLSILNLKQLMEMNSEQQIEIVIPAIEDPTQIANAYSGFDVYNQAVLIYPDIKLASANTEAFKYGVKIAKGGLYPSLSFSSGLSTGYSSSSSYSFSKQITDSNFGQFLGFSLSVPVFNNYRSRAQYNISKFRYESAKVTEQLAKNSLNKLVSQAVLDLKSAIKSYAATKSAYNSSKIAFDFIKQRYDVGLVNVIDLNTAQTNYNKAEFDFIQAKYNAIFRSKVIDFYLGKPLTL